MFGSPTGGQPSTTKAIEAKKKIDQVYEEWKSKKDLSCFNKRFHSSLAKKYLGDLSNLVDEIFEEFAPDDESKKKLQEIAAWVMTKDSFDEGFSGLVLAGFGEEEIYPSMCSYKVSNVIQNKIKRKDDHAFSINDEYVAIVQPFAQSKMIQTFTDGIDPSYRMKLLREMVELVEGIPEAVIDSITDLDDAQKEKWKKRASGSARPAIRKFFGELANYQRDSHRVPVYQAISSLPIDELAGAAEALVNLNSFQKRVSMEAETVGGPIDVAVISKGDGFIWINRKHYFEPELNYHFFKNYYRMVKDAPAKEDGHEAIEASGRRRQKRRRAGPARSTD